MLKDQLIPQTSFNTLNLSTTEEWDDSLSIGEARFNITALHLSRFLQAVGNGGVMLTPTVRIQAAEKDDSSGPVNSTNVLKESTALKLQAAMRDTVQRGTANTIASILSDTNWTIGGKTGTGPGQVGPESDGWFAGLVFDRLGHARFTVATYVKHGGRGSGNAARISAELARFIIGANPKS